MMTEEYKEEYKKARKAAMKQYRTCASRGWSLYPPVLDEVSAYVKTAGEEVLGEMEITKSLVLLPEIWKLPMKKAAILSALLQA